MRTKDALCAAACAAFLLSAAGPVAGDTTTVPVARLASAPVLDGAADDWIGVPVVTVALHPARDGDFERVAEVRIRAGLHGDFLSLLLEWDDPSRDDTHKLWHWSEQTEKYLPGDEREDRLAIQFAMAGEYTTDWLSGREFVADTWHWKAARSNPHGLAHDKLTRISRTKLLRAYKGRSRDGSPLYIARPADTGDRLYRSKRYRVRTDDVVPRYLLSTDPTGSVADVEARGRWSDGRWTLELRRRLDTGHDDDVVFEPGTTVPMGVAVFNRSENDEHTVSDIVRLAL